ncbi:methyltransferase family protein [Chitinimonas sp. BJB300]|uniref:methyltransferase family protein n=1 Tax=Chitinimonas sp. BJB300 TaxID=1559339 RepID=UPI000C108991|nr:NnrU family protein [Chitinimonas sp. BJB300]PHV10060.1 hypothetical protein CSQ89_18250 [Chitinimonas sp. BJB300]TSJ87200.1 isoprenylcysteine carboxylmethyltransferase family protein [Chitinimonas sp. BJB300]
MKRWAILFFSLISYAITGAALVTLGLFLDHHFLPLMAQPDPNASLFSNLMINLGLLSLFGLQHSIMARQRFKDWLSLSHAMERSLFVALSTLLVLLICWQWRALPGQLWLVEAQPWSTVLIAVSLCGWALVLASSFTVSHTELFGLRQGWLQFQGKPYQSTPFVIKGLYRAMRHPLMSGFLLVFWATPNMTMTHFIFALGMSIYILIGIYYEENELLRHIGPDYTAYKKQVPMLIPAPWRLVQNSKNKLLPS